MDIQEQRAKSGSECLELLANPMLSALLLVQFELRDDRIFSKFDTAITAFLLEAERAVSLFFAQNPSVPQPACHAGCHWCCGFKTSVFPFEAVRIVT